MKRAFSICLYIAFCCIVIIGCSKSVFLGTKPDQGLIVPASLADLQAILDNDGYMNGVKGSSGLTPAIGEIGADNYYMPEIYFTDPLGLQDLNYYTWATPLYAGSTVFDWDFPYRSIFYANVALEGVDKLQPSENPDKWANIKGSALFYRAHMLYQLLQVFAPPYNKLTSDKDLGIPLVLGPDINQKVNRETIEKCYGQVINDLKKATGLLPLKPVYKTRPSVPAAYALLARAFLAMQEYGNAFLYADSCLQLQNSLMDFNTLTLGPVFPIPRFNDEVIFDCNLIFDGELGINPSLTRVDSILYNSYGENDLRKTFFFRSRPTPAGSFSFRGSYDGSSYSFSGLAVDEMYLTRAECSARAGDVSFSINDLNTLLADRWQAGSFTPLTINDPDSALALILQERRKELLYRGLRWTDLRRLNTSPDFAVTITRLLKGSTYTLMPNDPKYVYPIPNDVISFNPGMQQNPR